MLMDNIFEIIKKLSENCDEETVRHFLFENAYNMPDKHAYEWRNRESGDIEYITYGHLAEQIIYLGSYLYKRGFRRKTIAIAGKTSYKWILIFLTAICGNMAVVPLDPSLPGDEIKRRIQHCDAELFIRDAALDIAESDELRYDILMMEDIDLLLEEGKKLLISENYRDWADDYLSQKQIATIMFTSGTGGKIKAAKIRQENYTLERFVWRGIEADKSKCFLLLPLFHIAGLGDLRGTVITGTTAFLSLGIRDFLDDIQYAKPKSCFVVPAQASMICALISGKAKDEGRHLLGDNIVALRTSGAPLPENMRDVLKEFDIDITSDYGMTETCGPVSVSIMKDGRFYSKKGSVGHILDRIKVSIGDPDECGCGEVLISGQCVFDGYYKDDEETDKIMKNGVLYTGDMGYVDDDGYLYIVGRKKNVIIREDGINVIPEELEKNILSIPGVDECIVFQDKTKIIAKIYIACSCKASRDLIKSEINEINKVQPYFKRIDIVKFTDKPLLKTATGKIRRGE